MSDIQKAAVLLTSLPEEEAASLMGRLDSKMVEQVSIEIARLKGVSSEEEQQAILQFAESTPTAAGSQSGGMDRAKSLVQMALGKKAGATLDNIRQSIEAVPFSFLRQVDSQNILTYIVDEHPQTIALILSHLPSQDSAEILAGLPPDRQLSVVQRVASMGQTNPEIIDVVQQGLEKRMSNLMSQSFENAGGVGAVAKIMDDKEEETPNAPPSSTEPPSGNA